jgi:CheY-like chemotaxis protein
MEVVDLRAVVKGALDVVSPAMNAKGIRVTVAQPPVAALVSGDPDRLQQVVWNLMSNALKFTPAGGWVKIGLAARGADFVLSVQDSGAGIAPDFLPFVFDRFRQADGSMTREHGGLGLGLAIVKDIVELHGGGVSASSGGAGEGATLTIRLPQLVGTQTAEAAREVPARTVLPAALAGVRVLAVDDDPDALAIVGHSLTAAGASVLTASSGADAIAMGRRERFDVLVCDLAMPHADGFEVLKKLRESNANGGDGIYAIALTAHASPEDRARTLAAGFQTHLSKPFELDALIRAIADGKNRAIG